MNQRIISVTLFFIAAFAIQLFCQGIPTGEEFQINTYSKEDQWNPACATLVDGNFVIVWESRYQDQSELGVYGQVFDASGTRIGPEFQINTYTESDQSNPVVVALQNGGFVVCWQSRHQDGSLTGVFGQVFDASRNKVGNEFQANTYTTWEQEDPAVAGLSNGGFVVCWWSKNQEGVFAQRFDASGSRIDSEFRLGAGSQPALLSLRGGHFVAAWQRGYDVFVFGQIFDGSGNQTTGEFQINQTEPGQHQFVAMAELQNGNFVACWQNDVSNIYANWIDIHGQIFDAAANRIGPQFQANSTTQERQAAPAVTALSNGGFVVSWHSLHQDGSGWGIFAQFLNQAGVHLETEFKVNSYTASDQYFPAVTSGNTDRWLACWASKDQDQQYHGVFAKFLPLPPAVQSLQPFSLLEPNNGARFGNPRPTFRWQQPGGVEEFYIREIVFDLYLDTDATFSHPQIISAIDDTFHTIARLEAGQTYYWKILAKNLAGATLWSTQQDWSFSIRSQSGEIDPGELPGWVRQNPLPQGNDLTDLHLFDANTALGVGGNGSVMTTNDGGSSWEVRSNVAETFNPFNDVHFVNDRFGWAVAENGTVLRTSNAGKSWCTLAQVTAEYGIHLTSVHFVDLLNGWIGGYHPETDFAPSPKGIVFRTTNGTDWLRSDPPLELVHAIYFINENTGLAVGHGIVRTQDGGSNWQRLSLDLGFDALLNAIDFVNEMQGWAVGQNGTILTTIDGGLTWLQQASGTTEELNAIDFLNANTGWAAGESGVLLSTTNGGATWSRQTSGTTRSLLAIRFSDELHGWAMGQSGIILKTIDGGKSWRLLSSSMSDNLTTIHFVDPQTGWIVGPQGTILKSSDGGQTWAPQSSGATQALRAVQFLNPDTGWVAGNEGIFKTNDGGVTWLKLENSPTSPYIAIHFIDSQIGWASGISATAWGDVHRSADGGATWTASFTGIKGQVFDIYFLNMNEGVAVGGEGCGRSFTCGVIARTTDGGTTWKRALISGGGLSKGVAASGSDFMDVYFIDAKNGWVVGRSGRIFKTSDGGLTWRSIGAAIFQVEFSSVHFIDQEFGWVVGDNGTIISTPDGGNTWDVQRSKTNKRLSSVYFTSEHTGLVVGEGGTLLSTTTGGVEILEPDTTTCTTNPTNPQSFILFQNYPNPIGRRQVTTIGYSLPEAAAAELQIYNILGQRVTTLSLGIQNAGLHSATWNGRDEKGRTVAPGIYFYRIIAGEFSETKKLLLLR